jgi:hypothetical protein
MEICWQTKWRAKSLLCIDGQSLASGQNQTENDTCNVIHIKQTYTNWGKNVALGLLSFYYFKGGVHVYCMWPY